ncbi:hypothetical protein GQ472_07320 [archaeon]|nr:hypothetical protein [archaeon]
MFSKLLSFFLPKDTNFVDKEEIDILVQTVSKGFSAHRDKILSIEQASIHTRDTLMSIDSRLSKIESKDNNSGNVQQELQTIQNQQAKTEQSLSQMSADVSEAKKCASSNVSELIAFVSSVDKRLKQIESHQYLTRNDLEKYHDAAGKMLDSKIADVSEDINKKTEEKIERVKAERPKEITKEIITEVEREIDVSDLTVLEKNILKSLVELKVNRNVSSITVTDLTNLLYPEGAVSSKRPTVSSYVSKLALSGFLRKERRNNSVFISIMKNKVIDYFTNENYSHMKRVI